MLKLNQDQFDATFVRVLEDYDVATAAQWKELGLASERLNRYVQLARITKFGEDIPQLSLLGFLLSGVHLGYELAKTEAANERAQIIEKSEALG